MLLELTVVYFGWSFNMHFPMSALITIWALGLSMVALSAIIYLPYKIVLAAGILIVAGHNVLDGVHVPGNSIQAFLWDELHDPRGLSFYGHGFFTGYPVLPWIGIITLGYCFGKLYNPEFTSQRRKKWLLIIGCSAIALFILLRLGNFYGDGRPWSHQSTPLFSFLSFIDVVKYPPSLLYALITLGPAIIFLAFAEKPLNPFTRFVSVYGRVPMFYYLLHIYLIHALAMMAAQLAGFGWRSMIADMFPEIKGYGFPLYVVYLVWIGVVLALYPLCRWYDKYKTSHKEKWWLSYL